ncbi:MAG TPA: hypothetical protein VFE30_04305 [Anaeromyxobacteraceae bacterium]|nr:hypothetical protein [Anaeromyxobacteraceae bacterium]
MKVAFEKGEDLTPHVESLANWLEDRSMEGIDKLESVLEWVDVKLETELAGMTEGLRAMVSEVFSLVRELVAMGAEFVKEHPELCRAIAGIIVTLAGPELGLVAQPFLQQSAAKLSGLA